RLADLRALPAVRRLPALGRAVRHRSPADLDGRTRPGGLGGASGLTVDPVVVIGAGPVGLTAALLLARWGQPVVVLERRAARDTAGSRSICLQRDVLDVWTAVGAGAIAEEGVTWTTARTFYRDRELFSWSFAASGALPP